ncbi:MAG: 4Fe-4S dicluster domain-containing protein [Lachnospiraceae bacterium]|nr:4Fe-4S dicluster domain-containing protein [Lachnospiraceae bacterium]
MASNYTITPDEIKEISGVNPLRCMRCGRCSATCPSYDNMEYHPHQFVAMVENGEIDKLMKSESIYKCMSCMACIERCPRQVEPARLIEAIRLAVVRQQGASHLMPDDVPALLDPDLPQQALVSAYRKFTK